MKRNSSKLKHKKSNSLIHLRKHSPIMQWGKNEEKEKERKISGRRV